MAAHFSAEALPAHLTADSVVKQWLTLHYFHHTYSFNISTHTMFILRRRYTHKPRTVHLIMTTLIRDHAATLSWDLGSRPPLDPGNMLGDPNYPTLPVDLIHFIYHNYPTCPEAMNGALRRVLRDKKFYVARALLECGGDPRLHERNAYSVNELHGKAAEIVSNWTNDRQYAKDCSCGWIAPHPGRLDRTPAVMELRRLRRANAAQPQVKYTAVAKTLTCTTINSHPAHICFGSPESAFLLWKMPLAYDAELGRNSCPKDQSYPDSITFFHNLNNPPRRTQQRELFLRQCKYEYADRMLELFSGDI